MELKITASRAAEIQARHDAALPGGWMVYWEGLRDREHAKAELAALVDGTPEFSATMHYVTSESGLAPAVTGCGKYSAANAEYIAHARQDIADLLSDRAVFAAEIERLRGTMLAREGFVEQAKAEVQALKHDIERQLQAAEKVVEAAIKWRHEHEFDEVLEAVVDQYEATMARQSPESAPGSDLQEGAATHMAGEAK